MKADQVKLIKESYMKEAKRPDGKDGTIGEFMRLCLDGGVDFVTSKDCVLFDNDNELIHCVCINDDMRTQADFPVKIISSEYAVVQQIETIMSIKNFNEFLDSGYIANVANDKQKEFMKKFFKAITNHAMQPMEPELYWPTEEEPKITPMPATRIKREPMTGAGVVKADGTVAAYKTIEEAIQNLDNGDTLKLYESTNIEKTVTFDKADVKASIDLNGKTISTDAGTLFNVKNGKLTVTGTGKIRVPGEAFRLNGKGAENNPEVVLEEGVDVKSESDCCVFIYGTAKLTSRANMQSNGLYATIQGNGLNTSDGTIINIEGGSIITGPDSEAATIYLPQAGKFTFKNCTIQGPDPLYIKSGHTVLDGCRITATGEAAEYKFNGNGADSTGDAVVIDFAKYPGGDPSIDIKNSVLTSKNNHALGVYAKGGVVDTVKTTEKINIYSGEFNQAVKFDENIINTCLHEGSAIKYQGNSFTVKEG